MTMAKCNMALLWYGGVFAPKARPEIAQGEALGTATQRAIALSGRLFASVSLLYVMPSLWDYSFGFVVNPGASPRAISGRAFGATSSGAGTSSKTNVQTPGPGRSPGYDGQQSVEVHRANIAPMGRRGSPTISTQGFALGFFRSRRWRGRARIASYDIVEP